MTRPNFRKNRLETGSKSMARASHRDRMAGFFSSRSGSVFNPYCLQVVYIFLLCFSLLPFASLSSLSTPYVSEQSKQRQSSKQQKSKLVVGTVDLVVMDTSLGIRARAKTLQYFTSALGIYFFGKIRVSAP